MLHPCFQVFPRYYERLASLLRDADEILIFGNGKGNSSAMVQLIRYLLATFRATGGSKPADNRIQ